MSVYENQEELLVQLIEEVKELSGIDNITGDSTLTEIGIDSLNIVELIVICEQLYPLLKNPEELSFDEFMTLKDLHNQLVKLSN